MKRFISLDGDGIVVGVRRGKDKAKGEIESSEGEVGQKKNDDGTFTTIIIEPDADEPSYEEVQNRLLLNTEYLVVVSELSNL